MGSEFREQLDGTYHDYEKYEQDAPVLYRAIDPYSATSIILALFSPLMFFHWGFFVFPLAGVAVGAFGFWGHVKGDISKISLWLSGGGIALSLLLGVGSYAVSTYLYYYMTPPGYTPVGYTTLESDDPNKPIPEAAFALEGERVFLRGYMYPGREQTGLTQFVMSRDNGVCQFCIPDPKPTDLVFVELEEGRQAQHTTRLIGVGGTFSLKFEDPDEKYGGVIYHIEADYLR